MALPSIQAIRDVWEAWAEPRGLRLRFTLMGKRAVSLFQEAVPDLFAAAHVDEDFPPSASPLKLIRHWGANKPLAVINYSKSDRIKVAAWLAGVPVRAGIADGGNNWCYQFSHPFETFDAGHRVFRHLPMTRWLAGPEAALRFELMGPDQFGGASIRARLREAGWDGGPYVVFGPFPNQRGSKRRARQSLSGPSWPAPRASPRSWPADPSTRRPWNGSPGRAAACAWAAGPACPSCWPCARRRRGPSRWTPASPIWPRPPASPPW